MEFFSSYIKMLLSVGLCAFICSTVCDNFKSSKTLERAMATTVSLCIFITVLFPICSIIRNSGTLIHSVDEGTTIETSSFTQNIEESMNKQIKGIIYENFGMVPKSTSVSISTQDDEYVIEEILIELNHKDSDKKSLIAEFLRSLSEEDTNIQITEISK